MSGFCAPRQLTDADDLSLFDSGLELVDVWARTRAHRAMRQGTAVVYLVHTADTESGKPGRPAGFYTLSAHTVLRADASGWLRRNTPEQIPAVLLGMLGVDRAFQHKGLGASLLADAIRRSASISRQIGARALLVDPANDAVSAFYERYGFRTLARTGSMYVPLA